MVELTLSWPSRWFSLPTLMIEFIGVTTSETKNPRQVLPKAVKEIPLRIAFSTVVPLLAIMAIIPWRELCIG